MSGAGAGIDPASIRRLLVRSTNWFGDVVMVSPALRALRRGFPDARLEVLARTSVASAYREHPLVDDVIQEERRSGSRRHEGIQGVWRLARELRTRRYDLAVIFPKSIGTALAPALAGIPRRVGYPTAGRGFLLTHRVPLPERAAEMHHAEFFLGPATWLGCPVDDRSLLFPVPEEERRKAEAFLRDHPIGGGARIAIHPGASRRERAWPAERFAEVAGRLAAEGASILVLGAEADRAAAATVLRGAGARGIDAVGQGGISRMAALVARCDLFLGNDSGPMHIAAAMGTPTVSVFGPGVPWKTAPFVPADRRREVTRSYPCAPCKQDFFRECDPAPSGKPWCLESIPVEEVLAAVRELLPEHRRKEAGS
ncbi:MAG: lipopolysaccharide heptosyltransferase II [Acidobacteriota bacterium]